ncbi:MAG TPA: hypothetical protein VMN36_01770 [Verrucomicrobiales bacterium]|nr:hypothetical protein [Verrucomicrobiales bacterium]
MLPTLPGLGWRTFLLVLSPLALAAQEADRVEQVLPCSDAEVSHYTAYRATGPVAIDGRLNERDWTAAPQSPRFVDLITGEPVLFDTRAAVLRDDDFLYVAFRVEEPFVEGRLTSGSPHGVWDSHVPECFPHIHFSLRPVTETAEPEG